MRDLPPTISIWRGQIPENQVPSRPRITTDYATVNTFRPVERTYSTKIPRFRRPETATFRFIAHQACILYHKLPEIATLICCYFCRIFDDKNRYKYANCTNRDFLEPKKEPCRHLFLKIPSQDLFFVKKKANIFEKYAIGHILFKFLLYNNCNFDFRERRVPVNKQSITRILRIVLLAGIPIAALLQELAVLLSYDVDTNYFASYSFWPTLANILTAALFAVAILYAIIAEKPQPISSPFGTQIWISLPAAIGFGVCGIYLLIDFLNKGVMLSFVAAISLLLSASYVLLSETTHKNVFLGFMPPISCALLVAILYFDKTLEINAPLKIMTQCALLPLMLYFTAELRYLLGRELPRLYIALALGSLAASSLCILTVPAASITGRFENAYCLTASLAIIGINATVALRQWRYLQAPDDDMTSPDENDTKETDAQ